MGARRLEHLRYVAHDPLVARLCGLARIPTERTVVHWLKQFTQEDLKAIISLNSELLCEQIERLGLSRLTIDVALVDRKGRWLKRSTRRPSFTCFGFTGLLLAR